MKKNKGFTLIELLAIIVILAIIAVITVPIILNIIEESSKGAAKDSAYGYKDAVEKWYVQELTEDSTKRLHGTYTVSNGKLNNIDIPLSGDKPTNGTLTYSNNVLTGGCLTIGGYKVTFDSNGKPTSTEKGECEGAQKTILYYTYDPTVPKNGPNGKITSKEPSPNPSWTYYVKETTQILGTVYTIEYTQDGETFQDDSFALETRSECETDLNNNIPQEAIEEYDAKCVEIPLLDEPTNEVCGVKNGTTFCLKPNDYENSVTTLNRIFEGCNADPSSDSAICEGASLYGRAYANGFVDVGVSLDDGLCSVTSAGIAFCDAGK